MKIQFLGAAQTVTGSCYMLEANGKRFAVDCGMHQGNLEIEKRNREIELYAPMSIDFILVTHAHIDHSGLLPKLVKMGFRGKIYSTPPTRDLLGIMLQDSAHVQEMETEWKNKKNKRHGRKPEEPLYTQADALNTLPLFETVEYGQTFEPAPGIKITYKDAGHILGAAFIEMQTEENGDTYRLVFSGDLGRPDQLLLNDPGQASPADYLFLESTYGDRNHKDESTSREELAAAIAYSYSRGEKIIIPAFAVERAQEIIFILYQLSKQGKIPKELPIYLDSPLAIHATEIFSKNPQYLDPETRAMMQSGDNPFTMPQLHYTPKTEDSQAINAAKGSAIVISASGMCNAGRVQHHLRHNLWREGASVVFVGFQAKGTPGRKIVDGAKSIRLLGEDVAVRAKISTIGGFSAHAGQSQILEWLNTFDRPGMEVFLIHGEFEAQKTLAKLIEDQFKLKVYIPGYREECLLKPGAEPQRMADPREVQRRRIDWNFVFGETQTKLDQLRARLAEVTSKPWEDQTEVRDRMWDINRHIVSILSEL